MATQVICIANQKGGGGKTLIAVSLAHGLSHKGRHVLLIDLDPQGQSATALGHNPEPGAFYLLTMGATSQETLFEFDPMCRASREYLPLTQHGIKF